ncbi:MAG: hypothetical protein IKX05_04100, partial [Bacteroidales bacterium]|nr:hypothetical protein [Bacteroidales bacterium]
APNSSWDNPAPLRSDLIFSESFMALHFNFLTKVSPRWLSVKQEKIANIIHNATFRSKLS